MKNVFWISSYPKSGNTLLRLFLSCYFFSKDGKLDNFKIINNITIFNNYQIFKKISGICKKENFIKDPTLVSKYWIDAQKTLYNLYPEKVFFFKTHNARIKYNNNSFTNKNYTRGFVYIVRDPRSVIVSAKKHYGYKDYETGLFHLFSDKHLSLCKYHVLPEFLMSWQTHYLSWKKFLNADSNLGIIIKYEDLVKDPKKNFLKIFKFLQKKYKIEFNDKIFKNTLDSIKFKNLQNKERLFGFNEKSKSAENFFRKGLTDEWKKEVPIEIIKKIEKKYKNQMVELGYL